MKLKGGNEADDSPGNPLCNQGEIMRCRDIGIGEPVETAGDAAKELFIDHACERFRVDPGSL